MRSPEQPSAASKGGVFLATTALEDFWDASKPVLFLGDGCRRFSRRSVWEAMDGRLLETPWVSEKAVRDAYQFVSDARERLLPRLAKALNGIHGREHDQRYWRIFLGPWLTWYLNVVYDRYRLIRRALDLEPDLTTIGLAESCFVTPQDTLDFVLQIQDDPYNLQVCTKILAALGRDFPRKEAAVIPSPLARNPSAYGSGGTSMRARLKRLAKKCRQVAFEALQSRGRVILKNSYFSRRVEALLWLKTGGRVSVNVTPSLPAAETASPLNRVLREKLREAAPAGDEFDRILARLLPEDLPRCFVEDYGSVEAYARAHYPPSPRAIFSANAWYFDEAFKHWSGACAEEGTRLLGTQHGGYGVLRYMIMPSEAHELEIADRYYTWGWERSGTHASTVALPGTKLTGRESLPADNKRTGLLYLVTATPRFLVEFPYSPDQQSRYFDRQNKFVESLPPKALSALKARPHYTDFGWDVRQQWRERFPEVALDNWERNFWENLAECRLFITDHLSTTYLEALAAGKPTILFTDPGIVINEFNPDAQEYFDGLRAVGILHDTPESAAQAVGQVYEDVEAWWNEPSRQAAVERFRRRYARTSDDAVDLWAAEFNRLLSSNFGIISLENARK
ncbi:MAG: LIC12162 family transferase [Elusimicrobiota bacterium]